MRVWNLYEDTPQGLEFLTKFKAATIEAAYKIAAIGFPGRKLVIGNHSY